jgi:hypothetical protein
MTALNAAITRVMDVFFRAFAWGGPWAQITALALVTAVLALLIFRRTSNQRAIRRLKDRIISHLLEIVLYRDELRVVLRAQRALLWDNLRYLAHSLVPLAVMVVPMAILLIQADLRLGRRALRPGEPTIVAVKLRSDADLLGKLSLSVPPGIALETPPVRIPALNEVDWRVRARRPGLWHLRFSYGGAGFQSAYGGAGPRPAPEAKQIVVGNAGGRISTQRVSGWWQHLLHPGEPPLPAAGRFASVTVSYPSAPLRLFGWRMHWLWPYLVLTLLIGYLLKGPLRVQV